MKAQVFTKTLTCLLPALVVAVFQAVAQSEEVKIVVPPAFENVEGNWSFLPGPITYPNGSRFQVVYLSEQFDTVPATHRWLKELRWRPDGNETKVGSDTFDMLIRLSTTQKSLNNLSMTFSDNSGPDETVVLDRQNVNSTANIGPVGGPKEFDTVITFDRPFEYDPEDGNLLLDVTFRGSTSITIMPDASSSNGTYAYIANDQQSSAAVANRRDTGGGTIWQFIFVPEPSSTVLSVISFVCLLALRTRT